MHAASRAGSCLFALALPFVLACSSSTEPPVTRLVVGTLADDPLVALQAPDTVNVGGPFFVTVTTAGSACESAAGGEVRVDGLEATVTPYNMEYRGLCTGALVQHPRQIPVRLDRAGSATLRARGAGGAEATRTVIVR